MKHTCLQRLMQLGPVMWLGPRADWEKRLSAARREPPRPQSGTTTYTGTNAAAAPRLFYRVGVGN
jgi:hypothetical protein